MNCGQCVHFKVAEKLAEKQAIGHCMRFPRQALIFQAKTRGEEDDVQWLYPLQFELDYCGDFKAAEPMRMAKAN